MNITDMKLTLCTSLFLLLFMPASAQVDSLKQDSVKRNLKQKDVDDGGKDNRNVMLNAANNTGPRDVNIGLPSNVGGITVLENDLPVVYIFWPELPPKVWRNSVSLKNVGLIGMDKLAGSMGDLGYAVNSYSQTGTRVPQLKLALATNHFGRFQGDINVASPVGIKGWAFTLGAFMNFDPSTYDLGFGNYADQANIFRAGITKFFPKEKGAIHLNYKYSNAYSITNYALFEYGPKGKIKELPYFDIGLDSYIMRDGKIKYKNVLNGEFYWADMERQGSKTEAHNIDIFGDYKINEDWTFKFTTRFHRGYVDLNTIFPLSVNVAQTGYQYAHSKEGYSGNVGNMLAFHTPRTPTSNIAGRFTLHRTIGNHQVSVGLMEQFYKIEKFTSNRSFMYQTVEDKPHLLIGPNSDADGFYNYNISAEYHDGIENKLAIFAADNWQVTKDLNLHAGIHIRNYIVDGEYSLTPRKLGHVFEKDQFNKIDNNWIQFAGFLNAKYNITRNIGLLGTFQYSEDNSRLESYSQPFEPNNVNSRSPVGGFGVFFNAPWIQFVTQGTYLKKNNYLNRFNLVNPKDPSQFSNQTVYYDIQTLGWTTDFMLYPFKGFNLHYLLTFQDPIYKKFNFEAFGNQYNYSDNTVLGVSKVLMEIDPSYSFKKWRVWASFRYFSKQYANLTNALYFAPRWETFGGVDYNFSKRMNLQASVINFLNQRGASGTINGAELITDASPYYGRILTGSYIMPMTVQLQLNINL